MPPAAKGRGPFDPHSLISAHLGGGYACGRRRGIARALMLEAETRAGIVPTYAPDVHGVPEHTILTSC